MVDLACMRDAMNRLGSDSNKINPLVGGCITISEEFMSELYVGAVCTGSFIHRDEYLFTFYSIVTVSWISDYFVFVTTNSFDLNT